MRWKCECCGEVCKSRERRYKEGDFQRNRFIVARQEWFLFKCLRATYFVVRVLVPADNNLERDEKAFKWTDAIRVEKNKDPVPVPHIWASLDKTRPGGSSSYETTMSEFSERISSNVGTDILKRYFDTAYLNQHTRVI